MRWTSLYVRKKNTLFFTTDTFDWQLDINQDSFMWTIYNWTSGQPSNYILIIHSFKLFWKERKKNNRSKKKNNRLYLYRKVIYIIISDRISSDIEMIYRFISNVIPHAIHSASHLTSGIHTQSLNIYHNRRWKLVTYDNVQRKWQWYNEAKSTNTTPKAELHGRKVILWLREKSSEYCSIWILETQRNIKCTFILPPVAKTP